MFIRKIAPEFSNKILRHYIYEQNKDNDNKLILREPIIFSYNRVVGYFIQLKSYLIIALVFIVFYFYVL